MSRWRYPLPRRVAPRVRLMCLPYAGGSAAAFRGWERLLPPAVELFLVELPGRGMRIREEPLRAVDEIVEHLADAVGAELDAPFALFGHSMGALLAFELARSLRRRGSAGPLALAVSGFAAPARHAASDREPLHRLPAASLRETLHRLQGTPREILESRSMMELLLPILRADLQVCETYVYRDEAPLDVPLLAFGGDADPEVPREALEAWALETSDVFRCRLLPGDHFFVRTAAAEILRTLGEELALGAEPERCATAAAAEAEA